MTAGLAVKVHVSYYVPKNASIHCLSCLLANTDQALLAYIILVTVTDLKAVCSPITMNTKHSHHTL